MNLEEYFPRINMLKESHVIELKKTSNELPKSFWETFSSFSNTKGGIIILGIDENNLSNPITGVNDIEKVLDSLWSLLRNKNKVSFSNLVNEDVYEKDIDGKKILIVNVSEAPLSKKPVYINGDIRQAFIRTGDGDRKITEEEFRILSRNASPQMDDLLLPMFSIDDLDPVSVTSFKEIVSRKYPDKKYSELSKDEFLLELGLIRKDRNDGKIKITRGCLLFLGKINSIKEIYTSFHLDYFNRIGNNERWSDRIASDEPYEKELNIYNYYRTVSEKLTVLQKHEFRLGQDNTRIEKYPLNEAIREALVNMLAHADYDNSYSIKVEVYDGWIRFINPGMMLITVDEFVQGGISKPRNEILMKCFRLIGASERQGFGGPQIFRTATDNNYRIPEIITDLEKTELRVWYIDIVNSYPELDETEFKVFDCIYKSKKLLSKKEIIELTDLKEYPVRKALTSLEEGNKIEKSGKGRATRYTMKIDSKEMLTTLQMIILDKFK